MEPFHPPKGFGIPGDSTLGHRERRDPFQLIVLYVKMSMVASFFYWLHCGKIISAPTVSPKKSGAKYLFENHFVFRMITTMTTAERERALRGNFVPSQEVE